MANSPLIGEIRTFGFNFAPRGWALCNGQLLPISQNTALFSLLGTTYGGDGRTTFALPNLQGRAMLGAGQGPGLPPYVQGQQGGIESITVQQAHLPPHTHALTGSASITAAGGPGTLDNPVGNIPAGSASVENYAPASSANASLGGGTASLVAQPTGGGQPLGKMPPYLVLNVCIALQGIFPSRQ